MQSLTNKLPKGGGIVSKAKELKRKIAASKKTRTETRKQFAKQQTACLELKKEIHAAIRELFECQRRGYILLNPQEDYWLVYAEQSLEEGAK